MKKQNLFSSLLVSTLVLSMALPSIVNADPSATPPDGNVDATFNSVNAGYGTTAPSVGGDFRGVDAGIQSVSTGPSYAGIFQGAYGLYSEATSASGMAGGFYNFAGTPAVGVLLGYAGDALLASGPVNLVGRIYSSSADLTDKYVNFGDSDGVRFGDDSGTPQLTINGVNGDIADPNGAVTITDNDGLQLSNSGATGLLSFVPGSGSSQVTATGNVTLNLGSGNGALFFYDGVGSTPLAISRYGLWAPSSPAGPLKIIDGEGLGIADNAGNVRILIDDTGDISNIAGSNPVKITDDNGFTIANTAGVAQLNISGTNGDISDPNAEVTVNDSMNVNNYANFYGGTNNYNGVTKTGVMDVSGNFRAAGVVTAGDTDLNLATTAPVTLSSTGIDLTGQLANSSANAGGSVFVKDNVVQDAGHMIYTTGVRGESYDSGTGTSSTNSLSITGFPDLSLTASGGSIILNGPLAASSVPYNSVTVKDPQGFQIQNYTTGVNSLNITQDGELSNLTANPVTLRDDNGLSVKNTFATSTLMSVNSSGDLTAKGDIGRFYSAAWSAAVSAAPSTYATVSKSCSAGDYVTGCDFWLWNQLERPRYVEMSDTLTCEMHFYNGDAVAQNGWVRPRCFSPDG